MATENFIPAKEALRRYHREDIRTLKEWGRRGYILFQVINPQSKRPRWIFESPEARYERLYNN